jgi:DNA repair protein RadD
MAKTLRDYQSTAIDEVRQSYKQNEKVCLVMPTGAGKTVCFSYIAEQTAIRDKNVLIIAHRDFLLNQISMSLADNGVEHNLVCQKQLSAILYLDHLRDFGKLYLNINSHVTVASIQTLIRRDYKKLLQNIDLIIIDECHRSLANSYNEILKHRKDGCKVLGVTATPERTDGQGLGKAYDKLVIGAQMVDLIKRQYLCYPVVYAPQHKLDLSKVKTKLGDYDQEQLAEVVMENKHLVGDSIEHYRNISGIVPALGFCVNVAHAEKTAEQYRMAGIRAIALSAKHTTRERNDATNKLKNRELDVIFSCDLFNEGYDVPLVGAAIILRPTQSTIIFLQQIGRALRRYPNDLHSDMQHLVKPNGDHIAYIFDHAGNTLRHGLPTDVRNWTLEGKKRKKKDENEVKVSQCPMCYAYHSQGAKTCPHCGHIYFVAKNEAEEIEVVDGTLQVANPYVTDWSNGVDIKTEPLNKVLMYARADDQLEAVAAARGYSKGWVNHVRKAREKKK